MRRILFLMIPALVGLYGCGSGSNMTYHTQLYGRGEPQGEGRGYSYVFGIWPFELHREYLFGCSDEYYKNGRLKSEQFSQGHSPLVKLEFYENGRLKSEERFDGGKVAFGAYYTEDGKLEKTVGQRFFRASEKQN